MVPTPTTVSCSYYMSSSFSIRYIAERLFLFHFVECLLPPPPPSPHPYLSNPRPCSFAWSYRNGAFSTAYCISFCGPVWPAKLGGRSACGA